MTRYLPQTVLGFLVGAILAFGAVHASACSSAHADTVATAGAPLYVPAVIAAEASATVGSGSAVAAPAPAPAAPSSSQLHDPVSDPGAAYDDLKAAKHYGWAVLLFAGLLMLAKRAGKAKSVSWLSWLGKGKTPVIVAAVGAVAASCYDAATSGGSWMAIGMAALVAGAHYLDAAPSTSS